MKLVVTGGAGYIGSVVATQLAEAGHEVVIVDRRAESVRGVVPESVKLVTADIVDIASVFAAEQDVAGVLHFAAYIAAGESMEKPELYWENNTIGSIKLIEAMRTAGIKKLVFSSTAAVYGNPVELPITEEAAKAPTNTYGMTKLAVDMVITSEAIAHGLAATSLRYFNVAGSYGKCGEHHDPESHIIPLALAVAAGKRDSFVVYGEDYPTEDGTCIRDYIHVADLARAHLLALDHMEPGKHTIYNLGNGNGFSNRAVIAAVEQVTGKTLPVTVGPRRGGDPAVLIASSQKARDFLGWVPQKPELTQMVADAWEFYQAHV